MAGAFVIVAGPAGARSWDGSGEAGAAAEDDVDVAAAPATGSTACGCPCGMLASVVIVVRVTEPLVLDPQPTRVSAAIALTPQASGTGCAEIDPLYPQRCWDNPGA